MGIEAMGIYAITAVDAATALPFKLSENDMRIAIRKGEQTPNDHVRIIERRIEWLEERMKQAKLTGHPSHFDRSERDALVWALQTVKSWVDIPNVEDDLKDF